MVNDPFHIASSDHSSMLLTNTLFNGGNFLGWSRTIKMALGAKLKLKFIDGSSLKPTVIDVDYQRLRYLDWYKEKNKKGNKMAAQVLSDFSPYIAKETPFDFKYENEMQGGKTDLDQRMVIVVCQEMMKMFKGKGLDPRQYDHMSPYLHLFHSIRVLKKPIKIKLPDGTSKWDPSTKKLLAFREGCNNLYICKPSSKHTSVNTTSLPCFYSFVKKGALNRAHYFFTIVDDFSRRTWTYLLHTKDQVLSILSNFLAYVENNFRAKPKFLRSDNGTKIKGNIDTARALKFHFGLPDKFWGDCVLTATYLINKLPMKILKWKTPLEMIHGVLLSYDQLRVIDTPVKEPVLSTQQWPTTVRPQDDEEFSANVLNTTVETVIPNTPDDNSPSPNNAEHVAENVEPSPATTTHSVPPTRKSSRSTTQPAWLKDFVISKHKDGMVAIDVSTNKQPTYPLFQKQDFKQYPNEYELQALKANETWTLTELPQGHKDISSKWVYKVKYLPSGIVDKYKARLVIRGFSQKEGLNYKHTFSPVAKAATVRVLIAIATTKEWPLHQLDANNAFLHGFLEEEIYTKPPKGYTKAVIYQHDYSLFVKAQGTSFTAALVYVDDILLTSSSTQEICDTKAALDKKFTIKDLGLAKYFLGIDICNTTHGTYLHQMKYVLDLLHDARLTVAKATLFPLL
nr:cysteine-rich RLK (receptor-like protein kinase) 8 [Tanacetum cinerariifolium]